MGTRHAALLILSLTALQAGCSLILQAQEASPDADQPDAARPDADQEEERRPDADPEPEADREVEADAAPDADPDEEAAAPDADADTFEPCPRGCDDGLDCTADRCTAVGCEHTAVGGVCEAPLSCVADEGCALVRHVRCGCEGGCDRGSGTEGDPFRSLEHALSDHFDTSEVNVFIIDSGDCREPPLSFNKTSGRLVLMGRGATRSRLVSDGDQAISIDAGEASFRDLTISGTKRAVRCKGSGTRCSFARVVLEETQEYGLTVEESARATLDRCLLRHNGSAGLRLAGSSAAEVANTFIYQNGPLVGGVELDTTGELDLIATTVADNSGPAGLPAGLRLLKGTLRARAALFWNNLGSGAADCEAPLDGDSLDGTEDPRFFVPNPAERSAPADYALSAGSPAIDRSPWQGALGDPDHDYFGAPRGDGLLDSGAHEAHR